MKSPWKPKEEAKLLELYRERKRKIPHGQMWEPIALQLKRLGIIRTDKECQLRCYSLLGKNRRDRTSKKRKRSSRSRSRKLPQKSPRVKPVPMEIVEESHASNDSIEESQDEEDTSTSEEDVLSHGTDESRLVLDAEGNILPGLFYYDGDHPTCRQTEQNECLSTSTETDMKALCDKDLSHLHA